MPVHSYGLRARVLSQACTDQSVGQRLLMAVAPCLARSGEALLIARAVVAAAGRRGTTLK